MPSVSSGNETEKDNDKEEVDEKRCDGDNDNEDNIDSIGQKLASLSIAQAPKSQTPIEALADKMSSNEFKNVVVLNGAGISVSAGIPDFRTPGTGLYDNLQKYNLPYPEAVFDLDFYKRNPGPFLLLAKELWPRTVEDGGTISPTISHCFVSLLEKKNLLSRCYTQNIDGLEVLAGVSPNKVMECHGHFRSASCVKCNKPYDSTKCREHFLDHDPKKKPMPPRCTKCKAFVKPDIVFFGESLPERFYSLLEGGDMDECDLLIVMGTSLMVQPVASIPQFVDKSCKRLLINRELVGAFDVSDHSIHSRDFFLSGDCDNSVRELCALLGWDNELHQMFNDLPKASKKK